MAMKQPAKKVYRSANGKTVDMDMLRQRFEMTPAVGNARVNARGDELGPGGKIVRKREEVLRDYYEASQAHIQDEVIPRAEAAQPEVTKAPVKKATKKAELAAAQDAEDEWTEDADGNFVKKGD
jgi:hypothetical protein